MPELTDYVKIVFNGHHTEGGSQMISPNRRIRSSGCGLVASCDLILALGKLCGREVFGGIGTQLSPGLYNSLLDFVDRRYLKVFPRFGINGFFMCVAVNVMFRKYNLPYTALWGVWQKNIVSCTQKMLEQNIPVVFAVGPHYPFAKKKNVALYRNISGNITPVSSVSGHYMTILGIEGDYFIISSWGKLYRMNISEFLGYSAHDSLPIVSNILYVRKIK